MRIIAKKTRKLLTAMCIVLVLIGIFYSWETYVSFMSAPKSRLDAGETYPELPADSHHIYINVPLDHQDISKGTFVDFYILSPHYQPTDNVVFLLFDNQQEAVGMVNTVSDFAYFDGLIGKQTSYVLIGNRGVSPTLFPEVFHQDDSPNLPIALQMYGSAQQIADIEFIRKDMLKRGLLTGEGNISIFGGSGGGVLAQQFLDIYGEHVSHAILVSTGAPDLSAQHHLTFTKNLSEAYPAAAEKYFQLYKAGRAGMMLTWALFRVGLTGDTAGQMRMLQAQESAWNIRDKLWYGRALLHPSQNFPLVNFIMQSPQELEVKVRMWELLGPELITYQPTSVADINLLYETCKVFLADFIHAYREGVIQAPLIQLHRSTYQGKVMIWANSGDQDFGVERAKLIQQAYAHAQIVIFDEKAHHLPAISDAQGELIQSFIGTGLDARTMQ